MIGLLADSPVQPQQQLYQYGALGILVVVLLGFAWVQYQRQNTSHDQEIKRLTDTHETELNRVTEERKRETERADRADRALAEMNVTVRLQVLQALTEAQRAVTEAIQQRSRPHG